MGTIRMKISLSPESWTIPALAVALAVAYGGLFFIPGHRHLARMRQELDIQRNFVAQAGNLPAALQAAREELEKTRRYSQAWKETSPTRAKLSALHARIGTMARQAGINTTRFDPDPGQHLSRLTRIPLVIGCSGSFRQTCQFLQNLECLSTTIWVNRLHVAADPKNGRDVQSELVLEILADNQDISDQVARAEKPIKKETDSVGVCAPIVLVGKP